MMRGAVVQPTFCEIGSSQRRAPDVGSDRCFAGSRNRQPTQTHSSTASDSSTRIPRGRQDEIRWRRPSLRSAQCADQKLRWHHFGRGWYFRDITDRSAPRRDPALNATSSSASTSAREHSSSPTELAARFKQSTSTAPVARGVAQKRMADVATAVSTTSEPCLTASSLGQSRVEAHRTSAFKAAQGRRPHRYDREHLGEFFTSDPRGSKLPATSKRSCDPRSEREVLTQELTSLQKRRSHA